MYVYEFQRKARDFLLTQKLSMKSLSSKFKSDKIEKLQKDQKKFTKLLNIKTEPSEQSIGDVSALRQAFVQDKAFIIKKSPEHKKAQILKTRQIYGKQEKQRQLSIKEGWIYPEPTPRQKYQQYICTPSNQITQKWISFEERMNTKQRKPIGRYLSDIKKFDIPQDKNRLSGWTVVSNESIKF